MMNNFKLMDVCKILRFLFGAIYLPTMSTTILTGKGRKQNKQGTNQQKYGRRIE